MLDSYRSQPQSKKERHSFLSIKYKHNPFCARPKSLDEEYAFNEIFHMSNFVVQLNTDVKRFFPDVTCKFSGKAD